MSCAIAHFAATIRSDFSRSAEEWQSEEDGLVTPLRYDSVNRLIAVTSVPRGPGGSGIAYFSAPGI